MRLDRDIRQAFSEQAESTARSPGFEHPEPSKLHAYRERRLDAKDRDQILRHLAMCQSCTRELLGMVEMAQQDDAEGTDAQPDLENAWKEFCERVDTDSESSSGSPVEATGSLAMPPPALLQGGGWSRLAWAATAIAVILAGFAVVEFRKPQPSVNVELVELAPLEDGPSRDPLRETVEIGDSQSPGAFVLILSSAEPRTFPDYTVEIYPRGKSTPRWSSNGIVRNRFGSFALELPRAFLSPGAYTIQLSGIEIGGAHLIGEYDLRIR